MTCSQFAPRRAVSPLPSQAAALLWTAFLVLAVFVSGGHPAAAQQSKTIDINARIHVTVADEPDVSGDFTVDPDGNITMLYVNQVHVAGLTSEQAAQTLRRALLKFYKNPQVVVSILSPGGITVTLSGQVATQKDFVVRSDAHLDQVLLAADPTVDANLADVQITHGIPGQEKTTDHVNFLDFRNNNNPDGNPLLHDGDVVYVPAKTAVPIEVTLLGDFGKTGRQPFVAGTTVLEALQEMGGLTPTVDPRSFAVQHASGAATIPFDYFAARQHPTDPKLNPVLQDGDTLTSSSQGTTTNTYNLIGAVRTPAQFPLTTPYTTLADAIAKAGGLVGGARLGETTITHVSADGKAQVNKLDAKDQSVQASTRIYPGDSVNIPQGRPGFSPDPLQILGALGSIVGILYFLHR